MKTVPPPVTAAVAGACLLVAASPPAAVWLVYDRPAILAGEVWRLWTGHLVHFSPSHLLYNLLAFGAAGWLVERHLGPRFGLFCAALAGIIGVALLLFAPRMHTFGGLSGVAVGAIVVLAWSAVAAGGGRRAAGALVLILVLVKILGEAASGAPLLAGAAQPFVPSVVAHVVGAVTATVFVLASGGSGRKPFSPEGVSP